MDTKTYHIIRGTLLLLLVGGFFAWLFVRAFRRSDEPRQLLLKWIVTVLVGAGFCWYIKPWSNTPADWTQIIAALIAGMILLVTWRESIGAVVARPFGDLFDGGSREIDPAPFYSIAEARRKKGKYQEAIAEFRKQLERFPTDLDGQMKIAAIQAENLNDLPGAEVTIRRLCAQPNHAPVNIAMALNTLADWQLKFALDRDAARAALEKIGQLLPESEFANAAAQRIAHLASTKELLAPHDRQRFHVPEGVKNLGLMQSSAHLAPSGTDPAKTVEAYVQHLDAHPLDTEVREKLAILYSDHYARLDLATEQLDQLIEQPAAQPKQVAHWLNLLADLQIRHGAGHAAAWQTLARITEKCPNHVVADLARNRMGLLKLELKTREQKPGIKMGTYEQNIGLKHGPPKSGS